MNNSRIGRHARIALMLIFLGALRHSSAQQERTGQISGHVVDIMGATIPHANIFVRRNLPSDDNIKLMAHTDIHGDFILVLPEGGYDVMVTAPGFAAGVETVPVLAHKTRRVEWKLKILNCNFPGENCDTIR